ncbi:hypothetical protein GQ600_26090 [Phytophthora cactorum]|nr:hypothetical protein GQ600_26090 [Phytophthora cactorum]
MTVSSTPMFSYEPMQLATTIKKLVSSSPKAVDPAVAAMSTEGLFCLRRTSS